MSFSDLIKAFNFTKDFVKGFLKLKLKNQTIILILIIISFCAFMVFQYFKIQSQRKEITNCKIESSILKLKQDILQNCAYDNKQQSPKFARVRRKKCYEIYDNLIKDLDKCKSLSKYSIREINKNQEEQEKTGCIDKTLINIGQNFDEHINS